MARERMAKLLEYDHFGAISCHIMTYVMTCQISMVKREFKPWLYHIPGLQMDIWLTPWHPPHQTILETII